jgi:hypothetical protein
MKSKIKRERHNREIETNEGIVKVAWRERASVLAS